MRGIQDNVEIKPERLAGHLKAKGLALCYLVWGEEPLQKIEAVDTLRGFARRQGYGERLTLNAADGDFRWGRLMQEVNSLSLFASHRIVELSLDTRGPGREGGKALRDYAATPASEVLLIVVAGKLDRAQQKTRWYQALREAGPVVPARNIGIEALPEWLQRRCAALGVELTPEAATAIAERTEGNLLAARQELDRLALTADGRIEVERILSEISDNARFNVFDLIEAALGARLDRTWRMLTGLRQEGVEPFAIFGALHWELRRTCSLGLETGARPSSRQMAKQGIWGNRQKAVRAFLDRNRPSQLEDLLADALHSEHLLKSTDRETSWRTLVWLFFRIGGHRLHPLQ